MRFVVCLLIVVCAIGAAAAQPQIPSLAGIAPSLLAGPPGAPGLSDVLRPSQQPGIEMFLRVDFAGAQDGAIRAAATPGLAGMMAGRFFQAEGAEWQRHYQLGAVACSLAYTADDHRGSDRCWRSFACGVLVGAAKEVSDGYFDRRDFEATLCGAAVTALLQQATLRWEW